MTKQIHKILTQLISFEASPFLMLLFQQVLMQRGLRKDTHTHWCFVDNLVPRKKERVIPFSPLKISTHQQRHERLIGGRFPTLAVTSAIHRLGLCVTGIDMSDNGSSRHKRPAISIVSQLLNCVCPMCELSHRLLRLRHRGERPLRVYREAGPVLKADDNAERRTRRGGFRTVAQHQHGGHRGRIKVAVVVVVARLVLRHRSTPVSPLVGFDYFDRQR